MYEFIVLKTTLHCNTEPKKKGALTDFRLVYWSGKTLYDVTQGKYYD